MQDKLHDPLIRMRRALRNSEAAQQAHERATVELRDAVKAYLLSKTRERGDGMALARKLSISLSHLANLKYGYSVPSLEWAKNMLRLCGD